MAVISAKNATIALSAVVACSRPLCLSALWVDVWMTGFAAPLCLWFESQQERDDFFTKLSGSIK